MTSSAVVGGWTGNAPGLVMVRPGRTAVRACLALGASVAWAVHREGRASGGQRIADVPMLRGPGHGWQRAGWRPVAEWPVGAAWTAVTDTLRPFSDLGHGRACAPVTPTGKELTPLTAVGAIRCRFCTGRRRAGQEVAAGTRWYRGSPPTWKFPGEPWPRRWASAQWEALDQAAVTVRTSQPPGARSWLGDGDVAAGGVIGVLGHHRRDR